MVNIAINIHLTWLLHVLYANLVYIVTVANIEYTTLVLICSNGIWLTIKENLTAGAVYILYFHAIFLVLM